MKVFLLSGGHPDWNTQGIGVFEWDQALALKRSGVEIVFCVLDCRSIRRKRKLGCKKDNKNDIPVIGLSVPLGRIPGFLFYLLSELACEALLRMAINKFGQPDIVHAHFTDMGVSARNASLKYSLPLVLTEHSSLIMQDTIKPYKLKMYSKAYHHAMQVVAVSSALSSKIHQHFGVNSTVIPNIVNLDLFSFYSSDEQAKRSNYRIVSAGNLVRSKRHDLSILAVAELVDEFPELHLTICGDGPELEMLKALVKNSNLSAHISLKGQVSREELAVIFRQCAFFILPTQFETFGLVYAEAMAAGLPVIATRSGGPEDFVDESNGKLISTNSIEELVNAMRALILDQEKYDREAIKQVVMQRFSAQKVASDLNKLYNKVLMTVTS